MFNNDKFHEALSLLNVEDSKLLLNAMKFVFRLRKTPFR